MRMYWERLWKFTLNKSLDEKNARNVVWKTWIDFLREKNSSTGGNKIPPNSTAFFEKKNVSQHKQS